MKLKTGIICDKCGKTFSNEESSEIVIIPNTHGNDVVIDEIGDICSSCLKIFKESTEHMLMYKHKSDNKLSTFIKELEECAHNTSPVIIGCSSNSHDQYRSCVEQDIFNTKGCDIVNKENHMFSINM